MNKKFSTLIAAFLAAGSFVNVDAGVVKVTTPVKGKSYVIAQEDAATNGKFTAGVYALTTNGTDVTVGTIEKDATSLTDFTKWVFGKIVAANQYKITYGDKYLRVASGNATMVLDGEAAGNTSDTWVVSSANLGASNYDANSAAATNMIKFISGVTPSVGLVGSAADNISFYAENYDGTEVETIAGMTFNLKNSVAADEFVFIKIGDKFVSVKADGSTVEMVSADALKTTLGKYRATFKVKTGGKNYIAIAGSGSNELTAGTPAGNIFTLGGTGTDFFFDNSDTYIGQKGASMYTATGAANYIGEDGKTTAVATTTPDQRPEVKIYKSSNLLVAPAGTAVNPLISAEGFVSGGKYLLSSDGTNFQKISSIAGDVVTLAASTTVDDDAMWVVKETKSASGDYTYTFYNEKNKAYLKFATGSTVFSSAIAGQGYTGGCFRCS